MNNEITGALFKQMVLHGAAAMQEGKAAAYKIGRAPCRERV